MQGDYRCVHRKGIGYLMYENEVSSSDISGADMALSEVGVYEVVYQATSDALLASQNVTDGVSITSGALNYFSGILENQLFPKDYVCYVGDSYTYYDGYSNRTAYEYCMVFGDLFLSTDGTTFEGSGKLVRYRNYGNPVVYWSDVENVSLAVPLYYGRSNLGAYSGIYQYDYTGFFLLLAVLIGGVTWIMKKIMRLDY